VLNVDPRHQVSTKTYQLQPPLVLQRSVRLVTTARLVHTHQRQEQLQPQRVFTILLSEVTASLASTAQLDHQFRFPAHQALFALLPTLQLLQANALRVTTVLKVQVVLL
jgi:hypothetical protein